MPQNGHELFINDQLTNKDLVNYAYTIHDKISENGVVMNQLVNNTAEQAMLGDYPYSLWTL